MDLSRYSQILWDWNGTLLDDAWLCVELINQFLVERRLPTVTLERYRSIFTFPVQRYYEALGFDFTREPWERISSEFIIAYEQNRNRCRLLPGAKETLQQVAALGISQSILSASKQSYLEKAVLEYELTQLFFTLNGLDNHHAAGKEAIAKGFVERFRIDPTTILLVGDTLHDAQVAEAIGVDCCLVPNGHQTVERLKSGGVRVVGSLREIED